MGKTFKAAMSVASAVAIVSASLTPAIVNAWGDNTDGGKGRPSYTLDQINKERVLDNTITFNSISNQDVSIGDEKNFVGAKVAGETVKTWNADSINVKDGETYTIRLYVHNNNPKGTDAIAKGVKATFSLPTNVAKSHTIVGYLDSTNATPTRYWDEVTLTSDQDFYLEYVDGSAQYNNNVGHFSLSNDIIINGATLGYTSMNGEIPGCYKYAGVVTINVKVHASVGAKLSKMVRIKGTKTWSESVEAKVGDEVEYQIEYKNLFADQVKNVMIRDILPTNVEYVADSTYLFNESHQNGVLLKDNTVTTSGINIGTYNAKGNAYVRFTGKVVDKTMACGNNQLVNWASATVNGSVYKDDASVFVTKDDETCHNKPTPPTPTPDNPGSNDTPTTIVSTGPGTIVMGALGAGATVTTFGYYLASRKKLM